MLRILLLIPTTSYRTQAFLDAARRLGVEITVGSERPNVLAHTNPSGLLTVSIADNKKAAATVTEFAKKFPLDAVIGVDDQTTVTAAVVSAALGLQHNSIESVSAARNKYMMRQLFSSAGVSQPRYFLFSIEDLPDSIAHSISYPCVVKPLMLAGSRGVIRVDSEAEFATAFRRLEKILRASDIACEHETQSLLVENYVSGIEVAVDGLLVKSNLQEDRSKLKILAIFDKPDPLEGPFFEETIYVTPSRLPQNIQEEIALRTEQATIALGLEEGPIHAELRINEQGVWVIELAARSIGGLCSRALRFARNDRVGGTISLEELILRRALGMEVELFQREPQSAGVMMIPIPQAGIFSEVRGLQEAKGVENVEDIIISAHVGEDLLPLPEGSKYLGFIFGRAESPARVESALREAHRRLEFVVLPSPSSIILD